MPSAEKSAASSGIEMTPPQKRGATTRAMGSTAIISIAEICSVAFIRPISAGMADAAQRGARMRHQVEQEPAGEAQAPDRRSDGIAQAFQAPARVLPDLYERHLSPR